MSTSITGSRGRIDAQSTEGKGDTAGDLIGLVGRLIQLVGPVRLRNIEALSTRGHQHRRVEVNVVHNGVVEIFDGLNELLWIYAFEFCRKLFNGICCYFGDLPDVVFVPQFIDDF